MASNASRGARAKARTKKWLEGMGYQVGDLELVRTVYRNGRPAFTVKRDQFGSDLLAVGPKGVIFVQVKSGKAAEGGTFPAARRAFAAVPFPWSGLVRALIVAWPLRARVPRVVWVFGNGDYLERNSDGEAKQERKRNRGQGGRQEAGPAVEESSPAGDGAGS